MLLPLLVLLGAAGIVDETGEARLGRVEAHAFFYLWYGTPETDGQWLHWNHRVLPHWDERRRAEYEHGTSYEPPDTIGAARRPLRGLYSSLDPAVIEQQLVDMRVAGVSTAVLSWWGRPSLNFTRDGEGVQTDRAVEAVFEVAGRLRDGVSLSFHLEPYPGRTSEMVRDDIEYLMDKYGAHPSLYRRGGRVLMYVYDSYHIKAADWAPVTAHCRAMLNLDLLGLVLDEQTKRQIPEAGFAGFYTYFASSVFTWASDPTHWDELGAWAAAQGLLFVPSVGPGYDDTPIRPWNAQNTVERGGGSYFRDGLKAAVASCVGGIISVTSWNEYGEGTEIEPTVEDGTVYTEILSSAMANQ